MKVRVFLCCGVVACSSMSADKAGDVDHSEGPSTQDSADTADTGAPVFEMGTRGLLVAQSWDRIDAPHGDGAGQYRVIVLQASMGRLLPEVRAANPDATVLYQVSFLAYAPDGDVLATGSWAGEVALYEGDSGWRLGVFPTAVPRIHAMAFSTDGRYLVVAGDGGLAQIFAVHAEP